MHSSALRRGAISATCWCVWGSATRCCQRRRRRGRGREGAARVAGGGEGSTSHLRHGAIVVAERADDRLRRVAALAAAQ